MKFYDAGLTILIVVLVFSGIAGTVSYFVLGKDNPVTHDIENAVEKEGEAIILKETGIDVTPKPQVINATP